jgi:hypothetical protein
MLPITPVYKSEDRRQEKAFDSLKWLAPMSSHISDTGSRWSAIMATIAMSTVRNGSFARALYVVLTSDGEIFDITCHILKSQEFEDYIW